MPLRSTKPLALGLPAILVGVLVAHRSGIVATSREYSATLVLLAALATLGLIIQRHSSRRARVTYQPSAHCRRGVRPDRGERCAPMKEQKCQRSRNAISKGNGRW
jgi:hypothetical protein